MPIFFTASAACYACTQCGQRRPPRDQRYDNCLASTPVGPNAGRHDYKLAFSTLPKGFLWTACSSLLNFKIRKANKGDHHDRP